MQTTYFPSGFAINDAADWFYSHDRSHFMMHIGPPGYSYVARAVLDDFGTLQVTERYL